VQATREILDNPINIQPLAGWYAGPNGSLVPSYFAHGKVIIFM